MRLSSRLTRALTLAVLAASQRVSPAAQAPQAPAFRAAVDAVQLDVRVVANDGTFVGDLKKDEFRVFEDGDEQAITAFSKVELPPPVTATASAPSDVSTNTSF